MKGLQRVFSLLVLLVQKNQQRNELPLLLFYAAYAAEWSYL